MVKKLFYFSDEWKWCKYKTLLQTLEGTISLLRQKMNVTQISCILNSSSCPISSEEQTVHYDKL